ncbi:MAG: hypothetical protein EXS00_09225 [Phycisphaerales bacterium]|nr:hypothetical protein [Phycisphaerales bacterium]
MSAHASRENEAGEAGETGRSRMRLGSRTDSTDWDCCAEGTSAQPGSRITHPQAAFDEHQTPRAGSISEWLGQARQSSKSDELQQAATKDSEVAGATAEMSGATAEVSIGDAVSGALASFATRAEANDVHLRSEVDASAASIVAGPLQTLIQAALRRAIDSAAFAARGGPGTLMGHEVVVCVRADMTHLYAHVMDNAADESECAAFERAPTMGLCQCIAASLGGHFWLQHVPFGTGMFASVCVPLAVLGRH